MLTYEHSKRIFKMRRSINFLHRLLTMDVSRQALIIAGVSRKIAPAHCNEIGCKSPVLFSRGNVFHFFFQQKKQKQIKTNKQTISRLEWHFSCVENLQEGTSAFLVSDVAILFII